MLSYNRLNFIDNFNRFRFQIQQQLDERRLRRNREWSKIKRANNAVEAIVEGTDARLRCVHNYRKRLKHCACDLLDHLEELVDAMPSPVVIDQQTLISNPLIRTLLPDAQTIQRILLSNPDIHDFFDTVNHSEQNEVFALLFVRHKEKNILGSELKGNLLLREVRQTTISFYGHRLVGTSPNEKEVRFELLITLFESVVRYIKDQFLEEKKQLIHHNNQFALVRQDESIINPEIYLSKLIDRLSDPKTLIKLQNNSVRLSSMGIKLQLDSTESSNLLRLHELRVGDAESCVVTIIRYPRDGLPEYPCRAADIL